LRGRWRARDSGLSDEVIG